MDDFAPLHVSRAGRIRLDAPPERVFPLFTPVGERAWVPGWAPRFLWPEGGEARVGTVFLTRAAGEQETIWTVMAYEPGRRVVYARMTPGSRAGIVEVRCEPDGAGGTFADVTYTFTALAPRGNEYLRAFTEDEFRSYVGGWETALNAHLAGAPPPHVD
jgi:hypothetical protein